MAKRRVKKSKPHSSEELHLQVEQAAVSRGHAQDMPRPYQDSSSLQGEDCVEQVRKMIQTDREMSSLPCVGLTSGIPEAVCVLEGVGDGAEPCPLHP